MEIEAKPKILYRDHFINNKFVKSINEGRLKVLDPSTGYVIDEVACGNDKDINEAVEAALKAFECTSSWRTMGPRDRAQLLFTLAKLIEEDINYIASLESLDSGKPFVEAYDDIYFSIIVIRYYAEAVDKIHSDVIPNDTNCLVYTLREPLGVCGAIVPWNYPFLLAAIKLGPCLAMGNTMVLKPSEDTPLTSFYLGHLFEKAGFPPGVFNVVNGLGLSAGEALVKHPKVAKITFTGSSETGKLVQAVAAKTLKRISLELGGKSPLIICADADIDEAAETTCNANMVMQGQCCAAPTRVFVHSSIHDEFVERCVSILKKRVAGKPLDGIQVTHGPLINAKQTSKVLDLIESGKKEGAKCILGGRQMTELSSKLFVAPTLFTEVTDNMRIAREEIFGPVMSVLKFETIEDVIKRANDSPYGLAAGVFSKDIKTAHKVAHSINAGQVFVNGYFETMSVQIPFGGKKMSGMGREFGLQGMDAFCETKAVIVKL